MKQFFGFKYVKAQPTFHIMHYQNGRIVRSGIGASFFYFSPLSTIVRIPVGTVDARFMLEQVTADFQTVTVQGKIGYRITDPERIAELLDFSLHPKTDRYLSDDPDQLKTRVVTVAEIAIQEFIQSRDLQTVLNTRKDIARSVNAELSGHTDLENLGIEIRGVSVTGVKPTPDIARALEANAREANLKAADFAVYERRIASVDNEKTIRQKELETEIAVQVKQKQIEEAKMETKASVAFKASELEAQQILSDIDLEERRKELVASQADNLKTQAEAETFRMQAMMAAFNEADPKTIQFLASADMNPDQLIAQAFGSMAENASKIGQLNLSPDLLQGLLTEKQRVEDNHS